MLNEKQSRLARRLRMRDAVFIGLGSMLGAGIFAALSPAASSAQAGLLLGLFIAALVALLNALSSAQLARLYPVSGGTYAYARERLGDLWAWAAGWGFIVGKFASCAAVALTFGTYLDPEHARFLAAGAVVAFTALNYLGVRKTANATKIITSLVVIALLSVVVLVLSGRPSLEHLTPLIGPSGLYGILQSAGIWFFAFAGYARIATLGEEVENPGKNIPRAILTALGIALIIYFAVVLSALSMVGPAGLAGSDAPLITAVTAAGHEQWRWLVVLGSTLATLGVLLSLMTGVSRTMFAMAADRWLPSFLAKVHPVHKVPHLAEVTVGSMIAIIVLLADVRSAIGFSSFTVLLYYSITNLAAYTLRKDERLYGRKLAMLGMAGCLILSFSLPPPSVITGSLVMLVGLPIFLVQRRRRG